VASLRAWRTANEQSKRSTDRPTDSPTPTGDKPRLRMRAAQMNRGATLPSNRMIVKDTVTWPLLNQEHVRLKEQVLIRRLLVLVLLLLVLSDGRLLLLLVLVVGAKRWTPQRGRTQKRNGKRFRQKKKHEAHSLRNARKA
jgi:hypothetical protein